MGRLGLAMLVLAALSAVAAYMSPGAPASIGAATAGADGGVPMADDGYPPCNACDARHQRLRRPRTD